MLKHYIILCSFIPHFILTTYSSLQDTLAAYIDAIIVKFKNTGELVWSTYYGGATPTSGPTAEDNGNGIAVDAIGNVYVVGNTVCSDFPTYNPPGNQDYFQGVNPCNPPWDCGNAFIVKLNPAGNVRLWATYFGGTSANNGFGEIANKIKLDGQNNIYIVGDRAGINTPLKNKAGAYNNSSTSALIPFILKFNSSDSLLWSTRFPSRVINNIAIDASNNKFITGSTANGLPILNAGGNSTFGGGQRDAFATKFDVNDTINWSTYFGGINTDLGNSITVDGFGNVFMTGNTLSDSTSLPLVNPGSPTYYLGTNQGGNTYGDAYIAEFLNSGALVWATYFGGTGDEVGNDITSDANSNIYLTGETNSQNSLPFPSPNLANAFSQNTMQGISGDAFLVAFTSSHQRIWTTYFGGTLPLDPTNSRGLDIAFGITAFQNSKLYIVGTSYSDTTFPLSNGGGPPVYFNNNNAGISGFISRFDISIMPIGINELDLYDGEITIFPNPSSESITIVFNHPINEKVNLKLYNNLGQEIYSQYSKPTDGKIELKLPRLESGIYIIQIIVDSKSITKKLVLTSKK